MVSELKNPSATKRFIDDVKQGYKNIKNNPYMYSLSTDTRLQDAGYRTVSIKNYLIIYRIEEEDNLVIVIRVLYGGRDYSKFI